jgi:hypothetical protein
VPDPGAPYGRDPATGEPLSDKYLVRGRRLDVLIDAIMMMNPTRTIVSSQADEREG